VALLTDILKPRAEEIFEMAKEKIDSQGLSNSINAGVVITGGSAQLEGLIEIADDIFAAPVRVGRPFGMGGLIDKVNAPDFATATGLIKYGMLDLKDRGILKQKPEGFFQRVKRQLGF
jgi:cell division protein FtsA